MWSLDFLSVLGLFVRNFVSLLNPFALSLSKGW
jgi:hypothetical protein